MNLALKTEATSDADAARLTLAHAIKDHRKTAKAVEELKAAVANAERRMAELREGLAEFTSIMSRLAEAASIALRDGAELVTPPELAVTKQRHERALAEIEFAEGGLARLRADLALRAKDLAAAHDRGIEAINPITMDAGESLADEVLRLESLAAVARGKLVAFSKSGQGGCVQRLGPQALQALRNEPENAREVRTNTPQWRKEQNFKKCMVNFRKALEVDANAKLSLTTRE
ncbi:hypothetical protein QEV83_02880 [Methylocapsa sp. D3K7]|uniref:hypothetical protein n=1 Tax=Methylocapsa sp. D3K7 TaxID=3041435 RepID=UPI00244E60DB|nr:hypothetical protein [Methylocapsa sp. D3K7]WGJ15262.1 hypothetical protein QEV83_02880 [Methylocapsa sp. D3K7]